MNTDDSVEIHNPVPAVHGESGADNFVMKNPLTAVAVAMLAGALAARFLSGRTPRNLS